MQAGKLNTLVQFQVRSSTQDAAGQPVDVWTPVGDYWAQVAMGNGVQGVANRSRERAGELTAVNLCSVRVRYKSPLLAGMRGIANGITYMVLSVVPDEAGRQYLDLVCEVVK